ncbi:MAG: ATP-grasp domain-containing protein, partial [Candidatus Thorarchaeota archaeon]
FIFEFVSGGGYSNELIPSSLFCEGYGMLKSIIEDFHELNFEIYTILDRRIAFLSQFLKADHIIFVEENSNYLDKFYQVLPQSDSCFIIAPEFLNILYKLTEIAIIYKKELYSVGLKGIKVGASKMSTYKFFKRFQVPTPETFYIPTVNHQFDLEFIYNKFHELNHSIIIKPDDGVGAESILFINDENQIHDLFETDKVLLDDSRRYIIQKYIKGTDMSASLIGIPDQNRIKTYIVGVNTQNVVLRKGRFNSQYNGGMTPAQIGSDIRETLQVCLHKLDLSHFKGYFGIDFILTTENAIKFIEINPRLTTSYLGIRNIYDIKPLKYIINPNGNNIKKFVNPVYFSEFYRLDLRYIGHETQDLIRKDITPKILEEIPELTAPPISLDKVHTERYSCFVATKTQDIDSSKKRKHEILKQLNSYDFVQLD